MNDETPQRLQTTHTLPKINRHPKSKPPKISHINTDTNNKFFQHRVLHSCRRTEQEQEMEGNIADGGEGNNKIKGAWNPDEDAHLVKLVELHGAKNWTMISAAIPGRSGKSCRLRWCNQLSPAVQHRPFTPAEDATIVAAHARYGNKWAAIARLLQGRTDNSVKNHWNSTLRRRRQAEQLIAVAEGQAGGNPGVYVQLHDEESDHSEGVRKRKRVCMREEEEMTSLSLKMPGEKEEIRAAEQEEEDEEEEGNNKREGLLAVMREMIAEEVRNYMSRLQRQGGSDQTQMMMMMQRCENLKAESTSNT